MSYRSKLARGSCALLALFVLGRSGGAQSLFVERRPVPGPARGATLPLVDWKVDLRVVDQAVDLASEQVFENRSGATVEAEYLFPLPRGAVARNFELWMGDEPVEAEVLDTERAKEVYESIVRRLRDPALLEYAGCDLLRARIFPIPPGTQARIRTHLGWIAPRLGSLTAIQLPLHVPEGRPHFRLDAALTGSAPLSTVFAPGLDLDVVSSHGAETRASAECRLEGTRRVTLYVGRTDEATASVLCQKNAEEGHFLLSLHAPAPSGRPRVPRDLVFVLDRSGSMKGEKMQQAVAALHHGLRSLEPGDRFEIVSFATEARSLFGELAEANPTNVAAAHAHLDSLRATGGTALAEALQRSFDVVRKSTRRSVLVLVTDGAPTIGETDPERILALSRDASPPRLSLFSFGVGADVDTRLLDRLSDQGQGVADYVLPEEDLEVPVSAFFDRIGDPVLTDVAVTVEGVEILETYPRKLGDLYAGSAIHVLGRYRGAGKARVVIRGKDADGDVERTGEVEFAVRATENESLLALFALRKVAYLLEQIRRNGPDRELVDEVVRVGREYGIVTPFTAALVLEDESLLRTRFAEQVRFGNGLGAPASSASIRGRLEALGYLGTENLEEEIGALDQLATGEEALRKSAALRDLTGPAPAGLPSAERAFGGRRGGAGGGGSADKEGATLPPVRHAAGRTFLRIGECWVDRVLEDSPPSDPPPRPRTVVAFSPEYFQLLESHPELRSVLALGDRLLFAVDGEILSIVPETPGAPPSRG